MIFKTRNQRSYLSSEVRWSNFLEPQIINFWTAEPEEISVRCTGPDSGAIKQLTKHL